MPSIDVGVARSNQLLNSVCHVNAPSRRNDGKLKYFFVLLGIAGQSRLRQQGKQVNLCCMAAGRISAMCTADWADCTKINTQGTCVNPECARVPAHSVLIMEKNGWDRERTIQFCPAVIVCYYSCFHCYFEQENYCDLSSLWGGEEEEAATHPIF